MRCSSCEPLLDQYVEGTLAPRTMSAVSAHLKTCDACRVLLTELRVVDALLATSPKLELPPNFTFALMADIRSLAPPKRVSHPLWPWLTGYVLVAWVLAFGTVSTHGTLAPMLTDIVRSAFADAQQLLGVFSGAAQAFGSSNMTFIAGVVTLLVIDGLFVAGVFAFYRSLRSRLAAQRLSEGDSA